MKQWMIMGWSLVLTAALAGCGGSDPGEGPPPMMPTSAVVAPAEARTIDDDVALVASLAARERVDVASELNGTVREIRFGEGRPVAKGEVLVVLDGARAKARLAQAEANHRLAESTYQRNRDLMETETISVQEFDQAEAAFFAAEAELVLAREEAEDTEIEAPFPGVAGEHLVDIGSYVVPGQSLTKLVRMDPLDAEFDLPERYVGRAGMGQAVMFTTTAFPGENFAGEVTYLAPEMDPTSRTLRMKAEVPNPDGRLRPGMFGNLRLVMESREEAVVIPGAAISFTGDQPMVVVVTDAGEADFRPVTVGRRLDGKVEIRDGVAVGDRVVVEGFQKMGPGSPVLVAPESERYGVGPEETPGA